MPGLAGPALAAEVAHLFGWRWVFLGLLPIVAVAGSIAVPALIRLGPPGADQVGEHRLVDGIRTAAGATMILAGLTLAAASGAILAGVALILGGGAVGIARAPAAAARPGTLTARPGLPATILCRGLLTFTFFGADAYVTLTITAVRHHSPVVAGIAVTGATLAWTAGAWMQARLSEHLGGAPPGPRRPGDRPGRHRRDGPGRCSLPCRLPWPWSPGPSRAWAWAWGTRRPR